MVDSFFEEFGMQKKMCDHKNNDGISCHDCFSLITQVAGATFRETKNYFPRRQTGYSIKDTDLKKLYVPQPILAKAHDIFNKIAEKKIYRGTTRIGIIAACILHAYKLMNIYGSEQDVISGLEIDNKKVLMGIQLVGLFLYDNDIDLYNKLIDHDITFEESVDTVLKKLGISIPCGVNFRNYLKSINNHCRITTAAAVSVWLYVHEYNLDVSINDIAHASNLTVDTLKKIAKTFSKK